MQQISPNRLATVICKATLNNIYCVNFIIKLKLIVIYWMKGATKFCLFIN